MAWVYQQLFNALNTADLNGQDSWSGDALFDVTTAGTPYEGTKHVSSVLNADLEAVISRSITGISAGTVYVSCKINRTAGNLRRGQFRLYSGATEVMRIEFTQDAAGGSIKQLVSVGEGTRITLSATMANDTYYRVGLQFDDSIQDNKYRCRVGNGAWGTWYSGFGSPSWSTIDKVELVELGNNGDGTGTVYFDSLSYAYAPSDSANGSVLVVAGGGGGGASVSGGGGAGGVIYNPAYVLTAGTYGITVGAGGNGGTAGGRGTSGADSVFDSANRTAIQTAIGGGAGGKGNGGANDPLTGGSGGGGSQSTGGGSGAAGTAGQGFAGGSDSAPTVSGAGGGGAEGVGQNSTSDSQGGNGGTGALDVSVGGLLAMTTAGVSGRIAGGGGGAAFSAGSGGTADGGGSAGGTGGGSGSTPSAATANTGGGGGSGGGNVGGINGANGGSGIVIMTYLTASFTHTGGNSTGTSGTETWVKFTASGSLVLSAVGATEIKTFNGLAYASTKTVNGLALASVKTKNGLA